VGNNISRSQTPFGHVAHLYYFLGGLRMLEKIKFKKFTAFESKCRVGRSFAATHHLYRTNPFALVQRIWGVNEWIDEAIEIF
jgi:hypothetical protein